MHLTKRNDGSYLVHESSGELYHVVAKSIDSWNKYDLAEIERYAQEHQEDVNEEGNRPALEAERYALMSRLEEIDKASLRALRANATGKAKKEDDDNLAMLEDEAEAARIRVAEIDSALKE